jgi:hypothetical protein
MLPSGEPPKVSANLNQHFVCTDVIFDKFVMFGKFIAWSEVLEVLGGPQALISIGEAGANLEVLHRAAGKFMNFMNPSVYATEMPKRQFFVVAHVGSIFALVLPLQYALQFQQAVCTATPFCKDRKPTVSAWVFLSFFFFKLNFDHFLFFNVSVLLNHCPLVCPRTAG